MKMTLKQALSTTVTIGVVLGIIFYAYYQSRAIISGPQIAIVSPTHGMNSATAFILVHGTATNAKEITLQGRPILIDLEGRFFERLLLAPGYNIIMLTAKDAQGRSIEKRIEVSHIPPENFTP